MREKLVRCSVRIVLLLMLAPLGLLWWLGHPAHPGHETELALILSGDTLDAMMAGLALASPSLAGWLRIPRK